jgi:hypothetical protein
MSTPTIAPCPPWCADHEPGDLDDVSEHHYSAGRTVGAAPFGVLDARLWRRDQPGEPAGATLVMVGGEPLTSAGARQLAASLLELADAADASA